MALWQDKERMWLISSPVDHSRYPCCPHLFLRGALGSLSEYSKGEAGMEALQLNLGGGKCRIGAQGDGTVVDEEREEKRRGRLAGEVPAARIEVPHAEIPLEVA